MDIYLDYDFNIMQEENKIFGKGNNYFDYIDLYIPLEAVKEYNILPTFNFEGPTMRKYGPFCHTSSKISNDYIVFQIKLSNSILSEKGKLLISVIINFNDEDSGDVIKTKYVTSQAIILDSIVVDGDSYIIIGDEKRVLDSISQKIDATTNLAKNNYIYLEEFKKNYNNIRESMIFLFNEETNGDGMADIDIKAFGFAPDDILPQEFFVLSKDSYIHVAKLITINDDNEIIHYYNLEQSNKNVNFENINVRSNLDARNISITNKVDSKLVPYKDIYYDLGSSNKAWKQIYVGTNGFKMRTFNNDKSGNPINFRPLSLSNNIININAPNPDGGESRIASFSKEVEEIRFYLGNSDEESFTFENYNNDFNDFNINDSEGNAKVQLSSKHKIDFKNVNAKIATVGELSIIPDIDTDTFTNTSEYSRIKFGGYELLTKNDIEDANTTEVIMCYKPANSINKVVPFAITKSGEVYYKGYEVSSKQYTENIINDSLFKEAKAREEAIDNAISKLVNGSPEALDTLLELSETLGNDPNFATTMVNALAKKVDKETNKALISNYRSSDCDFNDFTGAGFYYLTTGLTNSPDVDISSAKGQYYHLLVVNGGGDTECIQIASHPTDNMIFARKNSNSTGWSSWIRIDGQDKANLTDFNNLKNDYEAFKSSTSIGGDLKSVNILINKNLYNLGAYDTFVDNGDETATITRKTGYEGSNQYELSTSYTEEVILKQPLLNLPQDGTEWLRDEWEKGLNLCISYETGFYSLEVYAYLEPNTIYTIKGSSSNSAVTLPKLSINGTTYWEDDYSNFLTIGFSFTTKSDITKGKYLISFGVNTADTSDISNIMLTKGSHSFPYKPYNGQLIRQKEFDTLQDKVKSLENQIATTIASLNSTIESKNNTIEELDAIIKDYESRLLTSGSKSLAVDSLNWNYDGSYYSTSYSFSVDGEVRSANCSPSFNTSVSYIDNTIYFSYRNNIKPTTKFTISYTYIANSLQALNEAQTLELTDGEYVVVDDEHVVDTKDDVNEEDVIDDEKIGGND